MALTSDGPRVVITPVNVDARRPCQRTSPAWQTPCVSAAVLRVESVDPDGDEFESEVCRLHLTDVLWPHLRDVAPRAGL